MKVKYDLVIDFARPSKSNTIIISEDDTNSRLLHFTLLNDKQPMSMSDVTSATVRAIKKDGTVVFGDAQILEDEAGNMINEVEYVIPSAISDTAGDVTMTITLNSMTNEQLTSFEIYIQVRNALYNEDDLVSESDLQGFRDLLNRALAAVKKVEDLSEDETLPNPYAFNLDVEGTTYSYTGRDEVNVSLSDMAYIAQDPVLVVEALDQTAASMAAQSAEAAREYADQAKTSEDNVNRADVRITGYVEEARGIKNTVESAVGMAEAYGVLARENGLVAEGWAKGTQNGREVEEGSPYYNNNAEYFANKKSIENRLDSVATDKSLSANQGRILNDIKANKTDLPTQLSQLSEDETHRLVTDEEKATWNAGAGEVDAKLALKADKTELPTQLAQLTDDTTHRLVTDEQMSNWSSKASVDSIPTRLAQLSEDTTHRTVTDAEKAAWNAGGGGASDWSDLSNKPFESIGANLSVEDGVLNATGGGGTPDGVGTKAEFEAVKDSLPVGAAYDTTDESDDSEVLEKIDELRQDLTQFETSTNTNFNKLKGSSVLKVISASANLTLQANGGGQILIPFTRPSGYIPVVATPLTIGAWSWCWVQCTLEVSNNRVNAIIKSTNEAGTFPVSVAILFIKEDLVS